ncbi:hypothetical protein EDB89DRAFT_457029 [Lactarius sanguifluus]|nr:hypothetical protein EDB89DRAFT_457029 [Lactarius sanguifluus]
MLDGLGPTIEPNSTTVTNSLIARLLSLPFCYPCPIGKFECAWLIDHHACVHAERNCHWQLQNDHTVCHISLNTIEIAGPTSLLFTITHVNLSRPIGTSTAPGPSGFHDRSYSLLRTAATAHASPSLYCMTAMNMSHVMPLVLFSLWARSGTELVLFVACVWVLGVIQVTWTVELALRYC